MYLFTGLSACLSVGPTGKNYLSIILACLSVCLSICLSVCLSVCLFKKSDKVSVHGCHSGGGCNVLCDDDSRGLVGLPGPVGPPGFDGECSYSVPLEHIED